MSFDSVLCCSEDQIHPAFGPGGTEIRLLVSGDFLNVSDAVQIDFAVDVLIWQEISFCRNLQKIILTWCHGSCKEKR